MYINNNHSHNSDCQCKDLKSGVTLAFGLLDHLEEFDGACW